MTDDPSEAEELRQQWLAFDCVAEVVVLDEPGWSAYKVFSEFAGAEK
jgi:hypothetical protein